MKILLLCKKFPYPLKDGESIAIHTLSLALSELGCEVSLLAMNTSKHYFSGDTYPPEAAHFRRIKTVAVDNRIKPLAALGNLFSMESYHIARFISPDFALELEHMLYADAFDIVQLETLYLAPYIPTIRRHCTALVSMRAHNVEHEIWQRISDNTPNTLKRWYLRHLTAKLRQFEQHALAHYDLLLPITPRDLGYFRRLGYQNPAVVTPIGIRNGSPVKPNATATPPVGYSMSFIGSLDWMPNLEGLQWFIDNIWPGIKAAYPQMELHIAGRNTPDSLLQLKKPGIFVHGEVPCSATFIRQHPLMVVPLLSGSGMRAKILEGMSLSKVVLTTSIGLEGISATHQSEVMIADTPAQFMDSLAYLYADADRIRHIGEKAYRLVHDKYDSLAIAKTLMATYSAQLVEA
jgi:glycosyltransferase involved in cell wall biosynthesis